MKTQAKIEAQSEAHPQQLVLQRIINNYNEQIQDMDFYSLEAQDGARFTWNNIPPTKLAATRAVLPIGVHYTPYKDLENLALVEYEPLRCKCQAILNPYCQVDFRSKFWTCPFCSSRNPFPQHYAEHISEKNLPAEVQQAYSTIEYISLSQKQSPNVFLYVIDTCISQEELNAMKDSIQQSLNIIPPETYVGLITYGRFVFVHELGFQECPKSYALKGSKEYQPQQIQEMLGLSVKNDPRGTVSSETIKRFLLPVGECEFTLNSILDDLHPDPWVVPSDERPQTATGCAMNVAISLLESCPFQGSRIMLFTGGPCTIGPGQVIGLKLEETIRNYLDMQKESDNCKYIQKAKTFYQALTQRAIRSQQVIDIYGFIVDQFGLMEMKYLAEKTGGYIVYNEEFNSDVFRQTYKKVFDKDSNNELKLATAAKIDLFVSKEIKIQGTLGPCQSLKKAGPMVAETEVGQGGTTSWYIGGMDRCTTLTFVLDLSSQNKETNTAKRAFFQFQTHFKAPSGRAKMRVTTISRSFADPVNIYELAQGFDQEAACVLMARLGILRAEQEESLEVLKWLDRSLIRLICKFAEYKPNDPSSFRLSKEFSLYPQFMYHLRRSHFIQTFGASPDEISFYRCTINRENVTNCLVMIQPALLQYSLENPQPVPVLLDTDSMKVNVILLLDTYFQVITWLGDHIKQWKEQGYQDKEEYANFKELLEQPMEDVKLIMEDRFPVPIFFETYIGHTKERYLKSRANPSGMNENLKESGHFLTDDASLKLFMDHLIKLSVQAQQ